MESESPSEPVVTEIVQSGAAMVEEFTPLNQESEEDPPLPKTSEHVELNQAQAVSCEVGVIKEDTTALISVEECFLQEASPDVPANEEMAQSSSADVTSSDEVICQVTTAGIEAQPSTCTSETDTFLTTEEAPGDTLAAEDVLVGTEVMADAVIVSESAASGEISVDEELETNIIPSEVQPMTDTAVGEENKFTSETACSNIPEEELISFRTADSPVLDAAVPDQASSDLTHDLPEDTTFLKPVSAQQPQEEQAIALLVELQDNLEPEVSASEGTSAQSSVVEKEEEEEEEEEALSEGSDEPAVDLEGEMNDEVKEIKLNNS